MAAHCTDTDLYPSSDTLTLQTSERDVGSLHQTVDTKRSFMLGNTEIIVAQRKRTFAIDIMWGWHREGNKFAVPVSGSSPAICSTRVNDPMLGGISEDYSYTTTVLYFLDNRYGNALGVEIIEHLSFSAQATKVEFIGVWGAETFPKYLIINNIKTITTNYFIVLNGVKTILKTSSQTITINGISNPLIIVWPLPPSQGITFDNDIKAYGFYDYNAGGDEMKLKDGGADFYFTDWMRELGAKNRDYDQLQANNRYYTFYLNNPSPTTEAISNPGILTEEFHKGSIAVDQNGNICYSVELGGDIFNSITNGDLQTLIGMEGAHFKAYPVGII